MVALVLLACSLEPASARSDGASFAAPETVMQLTLAGSSTVQPVVEIAGQAYEKLHPNVRVDVQGGGSAVGISSARSGLADVGTVSRALKAEEGDLTATTIALDGVAIVVHASNPVSAITRDQVVSIYTGAATNWSALGGENHAITVVNKEQGRSTLELFEHHFGLKDKILPGAVIIGPNGQAITTVAGNPHAIAYVSIGSAAVEEAEGATIKRLPLDGVMASVENVANGSYPLMRPLNLVTKGPPAGAALDFIGFVLSSDGQAIVAKEDFVAVGNATAAR